MDAANSSKVSIKAGLVVRELHHTTGGNMEPVKARKPLLFVND